MPALARKGIPKAESEPSEKPGLQDYGGHAQRPASLSGPSEKYRAARTQVKDVSQSYKAFTVAWGVGWVFHRKHSDLRNLSLLLSFQTARRETNMVKKNLKKKYVDKCGGPERK